jgi:hypothetical protein
MPTSYLLFLQYKNECDKLSVPTFLIEYVLIKVVYATFMRRIKIREATVLCSFVGCVGSLRALKLTAKHV